MVVGAAVVVFKMSIRTVVTELKSPKKFAISLLCKHHQSNLIEINCNDIFMFKFKCNALH
jgi:hypothetical protein